jgi:methionyl-tRNA formyltransferase
MRVAFMGSPEFSVPSLLILAQHYELVGVVTQPDRRSGRGRRLAASPVKETSSGLNIPLFQPTRIKEPSVSGQLRDLSPDVIVVVAYGQILPAEILELPPNGCINVHASLLPRWRGAAPIPAAILHGDKASGVTIMKMDVGLDTGPVISQRPVELAPDETSATLSDRLALVGSELLHQTLLPYCAGRLVPQPQDDSLATYAPILKKSDGLLDWRKGATDLERQVRAFNPWPGSYFEWNSRRLIVLRAHAQLNQSCEPGEITMVDELPAVGTSHGVFVLETLQPAGSKPMQSDVFLRGARGFLGTKLSVPD